MKFLKNIQTIEEEDESQSSVNNNIQPIITDTDTFHPTIDLEDEIYIEEINEESNAEDKNNKGDKTGDETLNFKNIQNNYMIAHQIQEKWEKVYPFAIYSVKQKGWLCKVCPENGEGTEHWITLAVKSNQHPTRTFEGHLQSQKHTNAIRKQQAVKQMLVKGRVYKQMCAGERKQMVSTKERNRRIIKKLLKTSHFVVKKVGFTRKVYRHCRLYQGLR